MIICNGSSLSYYERPDCHLRTDIAGRFDTVAGIRIIASFLGLFGAASVIFSVLFKRRIFNAEIHPIFMLSLSDCILAILWITGSSIWLADPSLINDAWCYAVTLMTIIMECVAINLTLVYAIFAYMKMRKTNLTTILAHMNQNDLSWKKVLVIYCIAWVCPIVIVMLTFTIIEVTGPFIASADDCSCWCAPTLINIEPFVRSVDKGSQDFQHLEGRLSVTLGVILVLHYIVVFAAISVLYCKILLKIKKLRQEHEERLFGHKRSGSLSNNYGTTEASRIMFGQTQAKKRIVLFLTVFICSGLCNMILALILVIFLSPHLEKVSEFKERNPNDHHPDQFYTFMAFLYAQSITLPLQGFMNAIVYGWTRDDFVHTIGALNSSPECTNPNNIVDNLSVGTEMEVSDRHYEETLQQHSDYEEEYSGSFYQRSRAN